MANEETSNGNAGEGAMAEIDIILAAIEFPASRDDLIEMARDSDAKDEVIVFFENLPDDDYSSSDEVRSAAGRSSGGDQSNRDQDNS
jgi:hypothetical protein